MEYTSKLFVDFLKKLIVFDKDSQSLIQVASRVINDRDAGEKNASKGPAETAINEGGAVISMGSFSP